MLRRERPKFCCGPAGGSLVLRRAWDPGWLIGSTSLSLGHPLLSHPWYGGLVVPWPVSRKN